GATDSGRVRSAAATSAGPGTGPAGATAGRTRIAAASSGQYSPAPARAGDGGIARPAVARGARPQPAAIGPAEKSAAGAGPERAEPRGVAAAIGPAIPERTPGGQRPGRPGPRRRPTWPADDPVGKRLLPQPGGGSLGDRFRRAAVPQHPDLRSLQGAA